VSTPLQQGGTVTLALTGGRVTGQVALGPDAQRGPAVWDVATIIFKTSRPGLAPVPRIEVYLDDTGNAGQLQFLSYDGSFGNAGGNCRVTRGQRLIAVWTGGTAGDVGSFTVTGTKE
jgi:hypothetical protein